MRTQHTLLALVSAVVVGAAATYFAPAQVFKTTAALDLCVDANSGDDANSCVCGAPCATPNVALSKIPFEVRHPVTVTIDGGSYGGFALANHTFNAENATNGAYILVRGPPQVSFTVATGAADGGVKSVATDSVGFHVVTDGENAFTTNDLRSRYLSLISGTGAGQALPIISNTATTITVSGTFSPAPIAGTVYAVTTPATRITSTVNAPATAESAAGGAAGLLINNLTSPRGLVSAGTVIQDLEIAPGGTNRGATIFNVQALRFTRTRFSVSANFAISAQGNSNIDVLRGSFTGTTASVVTIPNSSPVPSGTNVSFTNSFITGSGTSAAAASLSTLGNYGTIFLISSEVVNSAASGVVLGNAGSSNGFRTSSSRLRCGSSTSSRGVLLHQLMNAGAAVNQSSLASTSTEITGCDNGVRVEGPNLAMLGSGTILLSNTTGVNAVGGGKVLFNSAVSTFTTNSTDIAVDGATSTRASFVALTPNSIVDPNYLSAVYLQP